MVILIANYFRIGNAIIIWVLTFIFLPKKSFKRYLPVSLFCSCLLLIQSLLNFKFKWWKVQGGIKYLIFDDLAFIFGPFFPINLWIFHFTYGKFSIYAICNLIMDLLFAYPLSALFQKIGHFKLNKLNAAGLFLVYYSLAILNYGFQLFMEKDNC